MITKKARIRPGGTKKREINDHIENICKRVKIEVEKKGNVEFAEFTPVEAMSQVVAGIMYFINVKVDVKKYVHIKVWQKVDLTYELANVLFDKTEQDKLDRF